MMGAVCDESILATRSDRAVVAWELSRWSCLYFLYRAVAYFRVSNATHLGTALHSFGGLTCDSGFGRLSVAGL